MLAAGTFSEDGSEDFVLPFFFFFILSVSTCSLSAWLAWNIQLSTVHNNCNHRQQDVL